MDEQFDISALEKALSPKSRKPRQDLSLRLAKSNQELFDEAKKLASELNDVYARKLRTRYKGDSYYVAYSSFYKNNHRVDDVSNVSIRVFENLVNNGRRLMKDYHNMINTLVMQNPGLALEANLEGKTGTEVLNYAYKKRLDELDNLIKGRISSPNAEFYVKCNMQFESSAISAFQVSIGCWLHRSGVKIEGIDLHAKKPQDMAKLVHFLTHFEQVIDQANQQLDEIEIRRR